MTQSSEAALPDLPSPPNLPRPPARWQRDALALSLSVSLLASAKLIDHPYREAWRMAIPLLGYAGARLVSVAAARAGKRYLERRVAHRLLFLTKQADTCTPGTRRWLHFTQQRDAYGRWLAARQSTDQ